MMAVHIIFGGFTLLLLSLGGAPSALIPTIALWVVFYFFTRNESGDSRDNHQSESKLPKVTSDMITTANGRVNISDAKAILRQILKETTSLDAFDISIEIESLVDEIRSETEAYKEDLAEMKKDMREAKENLKKLKAHLKQIDPSNKDEIEDVEVDIEDAIYEVEHIKQSMEEHKKEAAAFRSDKKEWLVNYINNLNLQ